jgi:hypothetical protein
MKKDWNFVFCYDNIIEEDKPNCFDLVAWQVPL